MIGGVQPKVLLSQDENGELHMIEEQMKLMGVIEDEFSWRLVREGDGLNKKSKSVMWLEWNEDGTFKEKHDDIAVGRSLIMSPFNHFFTWQTTVVTEVLEVTEDLSYIKFKTKNSTYELFKL
jgi:hypothetical protein